MKKSLALVLALIMVLSSFSFVSAAPDFSDVAGTKYEDAVTRLELLNVLKGYPDGTFKPEGSITRAEFAAVAVRAKGLAAVAEASKGLPSGFSDVPAGHWAAGYVGVAGSTGIVKGIGGGLFAPNAPVKYEEAVTMLVRALGYEQDALSKGGYPFGYLIVAKEIDLLDSVAGVMGMPATRGMVAMLTDNALEIPMMVQVGFGSDAKWVVSGTREHGGDEMYLLDSMGFDTFEGRVTSYSTSRDTITLKGKNNVTLDVADDFDYYAVHGVTIKAWAKDDMVIVYTLKDEVKFDATSYDTAEKEIKLITEDELYEIASGADFVKNGASVAATAFATDYAKIVLNDDSEIVWAEGYSLDGFVVVEEMDDEVIIDLNDEEFDLDGFTIVKDGKTISADDLEEGDIVFYNNIEEFAVVYNNSASGIIDRVYDSTSFRMDGKRYTFLSYSQFIDGSTLDDLSETVVRQMMDEKDTVEAFKDFSGKVVLLVGNRGVAATTSFYAYVTTTPGPFTLRTKTYYNLDVITEDGEEIKFDVPAADYIANDPLVKGDVIKITVEEDGDFDDYSKLLNKETLLTSETAIKVTDRYAKTKMLQSSAVVFNVENFGTDVDDIEVYSWADAADEFTYVEAGHFYYDTQNKVVVIVAEETDADEDVTKYFGLVSGLRKISNKTQWEVTMKVEGKTMEFLTDTDKITTTGSIALYDFARVEVGDKTGQISAWVEELPTTMYVIKVIDRDEIELASSSAATTGAIYMMVSGSVVYDEDNDPTTLGSLAKGDKVEVYLDRAGSRFVKYIRINELAPDTTVPSTNVLTYTASPAAISVSNLTAPTTYAVRIKTESSGLPVGVFGVGSDSKALITTSLTVNVVYTAELVKIDAPNTVLASRNFVAGVSQ